jgi:hypothetical protein
VSEHKDDDLAAGDAVAGDAPAAAVPGDAPAGDAVARATASDGGPADEAAAGDRATSKQLRLRRAPRYGPFGLTGALLGIVIGIGLALAHPAASNYSMQTIAGYFAASFGLIGAVLGLGVAVLIERRRS